MKNLFSYLLEAGFWVAAISLVAVSCFLFLLSFEVIDIFKLQEFLATVTGDIIIYVAGSIIFLSGLYYLGLIWDINKRRRRFTEQGERGQIHVSPYAIRDFVEKILADEEGLSKVRVDLTHAGEGVKIKVRANVKMGQNTYQLSKRLQRLLAEEVESGIGVKVSDVEIYTQSIGGSRTPEEKENKEEDEIPTSSERKDDLYG